MKNKQNKTPKARRGGPRARLRTERTYTIVIEQDEDGMLIASIPALPGCFTQARTLKQLDERVREAIGAYLEAFPDAAKSTDAGTFVALRQVAI